MHQPALQSTQPTDPPTCGRDALQQQIDALWRETRNPRITLFAQVKLYRKMAELRAEIKALEVLS
jgi:hypothetical protein